LGKHNSLNNDYRWKVSWAWWYSGCSGEFLHFFAYDLTLNVLHWLVYKLWNRLGRFIGNIR